MHRIKAHSLCGLLLLCLFFAHKGFSAYVEDFDTTDVNGYAFDSAFNLTTNGKMYSKAAATCYGLFSGQTGLFNYSFDDIKIVHMTKYRGYSSTPILLPGTCFVIKKNDSTYTKIQVLKKLVDNRFVFKYGSNTTPNDTLLVSADYDRSIRYKPNNLYYKYWYPEWGVGGDTLFWDPPLGNDNHILGYIIYTTKPGVIIDTSKPINIAQWDSVFTSATIYTGRISDLSYFNLVAVYSEGNSDFLQGWTMSKPVVDRIKNIAPVTNSLSNKITLKKSPTGLIFDFHLLHENTKPLSINIYTISGRQVAGFSSVNNRRLFWNTSHSNLPEGTYIIRAVLPDRSSLSQPFMLTK
jgi:hypothetical protein